MSRPLERMDCSWLPPAFIEAAEPFLQTLGTTTERKGGTFLMSYTVISCDLLISYCFMLFLP